MLQEPLTKVDKITMYGEGNASKWLVISCRVLTRYRKVGGFDIRQLPSRRSWCYLDQQVKQDEQPVIEAQGNYD